MKKVLILLVFVVSTAISSFGYTGTIYRNLTNDDGSPHSVSYTFHLNKPFMYIRVFVARDGDVSDGYHPVSSYIYTSDYDDPDFSGGFLGHGISCSKSGTRYSWADYVFMAPSYISYYIHIDLRCPLLDDYASGILAW